MACTDGVIYKIYGWADPSEICRKTIDKNKPIDKWLECGKI